MPTMPDFRFSAQSLQDYIDCPRRFELRYIQKLDWPAEESKPYLDFELFRQRGNLFHTCVDRYFHHVDPRAIESQLQDEELRVWWRNFMDFIKNRQFKTASSEITYQTGLNEQSLIAKYDLLVQTETGTFTIFDWKTKAGKKDPIRKFYAEKMQTHIYPYVLSRSAALTAEKKPIDPAQVELVYWFPQFPEQAFSFPYSSIIMLEDEKLLSDLIQEIIQKAVGTFEKTEEKKRCSFCVYRSYCERGKQAGNLFEGEAEFNFDVDDLDLDIEKVEEISY